MIVAANHNKPISQALIDTIVDNLPPIDYREALEKFKESAETVSSSLKSTTKTFDSIVLPPVPLQLLAEEQALMAKEIMNGKPQARSFKESLKYLFEWNWAPPDPRAIPTRVKQSEKPKSYREPIVNQEDFLLRTERLEKIRSSEHRRTISNWSTLFEYELPIVNLPPQLDGLRILHISDMHFMLKNNLALEESRKFNAFIEKHNIRYNIVVSTGDTITKAPDDINEAGFAELKKITARAACAFEVSGNHDYHGHQPAALSLKLEKKSGFYNLNNNLAVLTINGAKLNIVGIDDSHFGAPKCPGKLPANETNILIGHNNDGVTSKFWEGNYDLILTGHYHWNETILPTSWVMPFWGYSDRVNNHTYHWDIWGTRAASFVHPGLMRYYVSSDILEPIRQPAGFVIITLRRDNQSFSEPVKKAN
ncbi:MAG TPA: metallophosphoesterase family protein [Oligoflexia bacterium]|mgnify:CR=1 FL=1|nr:metallophosphoesterase family protein [Oligoflexia bacterium]HMP27288.1 metallophosphoesterase family protein [Oligoflexia bacterium]